MFPPLDPCSRRKPLNYGYRHDSNPPTSNRSLKVPQSPRFQPTIDGNGPAVSGVVPSAEPRSFAEPALTFFTPLRMTNEWLRMTIVRAQSAVPFSSDSRYTTLVSTHGGVKGNQKLGPIV